MSRDINGFRIIPGEMDILIVAPHGPIIDGAYENDLRTSVIADEIQRQLGCYTIINDRFFKPKGPITKSLDHYFLDLFRLDHARKVKGYTERIRNVATSRDKTLVVWVHGIADNVAVFQGKAHRERGVYRKEPEALHALIGYGQGGDPKTGETQDRYTVLFTTVFCFNFMKLF